MNLTDLETMQKEICQKYGAAFQKCDLNLKVGISPNIKTGERPIHGLRIAERMAQPAGIFGRESGRTIQISLSLYMLFT